MPIFHRNQKHIQNIQRRNSNKKTRRTTNQIQRHTKTFTKIHNQKDNIRHLKTHTLHHKLINTQNIQLSQKLL